MGKSTISMAIFNSFLYVYQKVDPILIVSTPLMWDRTESKPRKMDEPSEALGYAEKALRFDPKHATWQLTTFHSLLGLPYIYIYIIYIIVNII